MDGLRCIVDCARVARQIESWQKPVLLMAKANCYGLGYTVAKAVEKSVAGYGVAYGKEGGVLRALTEKPIWVTTPMWTADEIDRYDLTPCVQRMEDLERLRGIRRPINVHVQLNTGMNRFGISSPREIEELVIAIRRQPNIHIAGACTHYAGAYAYDLQNKRLSRLLAALPRDLLVHTQASSTADRKGFDVLRLGLAAYRGAVRVETEVVCCRAVKSGDAVGYDGIYVVDGNGYVAVIAGGYADGLGKRLRGHLVQICGRLYPIVAVCMDVCMVALDRPIASGEEVVVLGDGPDPEEISLYEMYTGLHGRCTFEYKGVE